MRHQSDVHRCRKRRSGWRERGSGWRERGGVTVIVAGALVMLGILAVGMSRIGIASVERSTAQAAADAAALAGAVDGPDAAERLAVENGAALDSFIVDGDDVEVRVSVGNAQATARARKQDPPMPVVSLLPDDPVDSSLVTETTVAA